MLLTAEQRPFVLASLYNHCRKGGGIAALHYDATPMTVEEAQTIIDERLKGEEENASWALYFDYLKGRPMKISVGEELDFRLYNRDSGPGMGERATSEGLEAYRKANNVIPMEG